jgi:hypothetical protein
MLGIRSKGWNANAVTTLTDGYVIGTNGEPPMTYMLMIASITFGGFIPGYPTGLTGKLVFVQDGVGGHDVNWNGKVTFIGSAGMNLAANAITVIEVINTPAGWLAHKWT